jgi:peptide deformylase
MAVDVEQLRIVEYPHHPALRQKALPVPAISPEVRAVALRMLELMREAEGIGLAAPQVGLAWRLFVVDVPPDEEKGRSTEGELPTATDGPVWYVNPVISKPDGGLETMEEGCLSLPDLRGDVQRPATVTITATDLEGNKFVHRATGLLARCWQHEMDHLDGVLILDRFTQQSRLKLRKQLRELEREAS